MKNGEQVHVGSVIGDELLYDQKLFRSNVSEKTLEQALVKGEHAQHCSQGMLWGHKDNTQSYSHINELSKYTVIINPK